MVEMKVNPYELEYNDDDNVKNPSWSFWVAKYWEVPVNYRKIIQKPHNLTWETAVDESNDKNEKYIKTSFSLKAGQYATMLMREALSCRTPPPPRRIVFEDSDSEESD